MAVEPPITPAQRQYLAAFDRFLSADGAADALDARADMAAWLGDMRAEKGIPEGGYGPPYSGGRFTRAA